MLDSEGTGNDTQVMTKRKYSRSGRSLVLFFLFPSLLIAEKETNATINKDTEALFSEAVKREAAAFEKLAAKVKPSVAVIESVDRLGRDGGRGTGFVVSEDGVVVTNFHVIGEHRAFRVRFADGKTYEPETILAVDRERDLALVKIDVGSKKLPVLPLGDSDDLKPGQGILALGNPLGYGLSVSRGVVAALRELEEGDGKTMVQVAIPIEPGSSGSPALDMSGRVVAVLAIKSGGAMGFGVPVNEVKRLLASPNPVPMMRWLTIGALDPGEWESVLGGSWRQRAGIITASGMGKGFGGRMLCLSKDKPPAPPYELEVEVKLEEESGAAGLVFHSDGGEVHYGFYPTNGSLRLTRFDGPTVFNWTILQTIPSPAYQPGQWNRLRASIGKDGKLTCLVNGQVVIDLTDKGLASGQVGLCKFRAPAAEFRRFRLGKTIAEANIPPDLVKQAERLARPLAAADKLPTGSMDKLVNLGKPASDILLQRANALEKESVRLRRLARDVRERLVIEELAAALRHEDEKNVDLFRAALLVARLDNEDVDTELYLRRLQRIAAKVSSATSDEADGETKLRTLAKHLFEDLGFHGSTLDYYHRSNSYVNEVMDDREGLPITLSIVFIELAERLDLPVAGLGIPGHFLAMYREPPPEKQPDAKPKEILIDPFGGQFVTREQASELSGARLADADFVPARKRSIIMRVLRNLLNIAEQERDAPARLRYLDALLAIDPNEIYLRAMRAMVHYGERRFDKALVDLEFLIAKNPEGEETAPLREIRDRLNAMKEE